MGEVSAIALLFHPQLFKRKIWKKWSKMSFALGLLNTLGRGCWIPVGPIPACQHPHFTRLWAFWVRPSPQIGWNFPLTPLSTAFLAHSIKASSVHISIRYRTELDQEAGGPTLHFPSDKWCNCPVFIWRKIFNKIPNNTCNCSHHWLLEITSSG